MGNEAARGFAGRPAMTFRRRGLLALAVLGFSLSSSQLAAARETVKFDGYSSGTVVVRTNERRLYYVLGGGKALRYPVGVGRAGKSWTGSAFIVRMVRNPDWSPPAEVK